MRHALFLFALSVAGEAFAQTPDGPAVEGEATPPEATPDEVEPDTADPPDADAESDPADATPPAAKEQVPHPPGAGEREESAEPGPAEAVLSAPRPDEQDPPPVELGPPPPDERKVELGWFGGVNWRSSEEKSRVEYGAAFNWGIAIGVPIARWLTLRPYTHFVKIPVEVKSGGLDANQTRYDDTTIGHGALDLFGLGARGELGLELVRGLSGFVLADVAWGRFTAPAPVARGAYYVRAAPRAGVGINYRAGLGLSFEPLPDRLFIGLTASYGRFARQSGAAFKILQGIDQDGMIVHFAALPRFGQSFDSQLNLGVIL